MARREEPRGLLRTHVTRRNRATLERSTGTGGLLDGAAKRVTINLVDHAHHLRYAQATPLV